MKFIKNVLTDKNMLWNKIPRHSLFNNFQTRWLSNNIFGTIYDSEINMLTQAINNLREIQVGLSEYFEESVKYFSKIFGLENMQYINKKVSNRPHHDSLDEEVLHLIVENNQFDLVLYNFAMVKFKEQIKVFQDL
jgi:hypothetical protein